MGKPAVDWDGVMPAIITPFDQQGRIDEDAFCRFVDINVDWGITGIVVTGCSGESWAMTNDERKRVYKLAVDAARGRIRVLASTSAVRVEDVIELSAYAGDIGCEGTMIMPPFFPRLHSPEDIVFHFRKISDAVDLPIMLYNVPGYNVNEMLPETINRIADIKNVVAIKESTTDWGKFYRGLQLAGDRVLYFTGQLSLFGYAAIEHGATGAVTGATNVWGAESVEFLNACVARDRDRAIPLQKKAVDLWELYLSNHRNLYPAIKAGMNMLGLPGGYPRPPLRPLGEPDLSELREGMIRLGFNVLAAAAE